MSLMVFGDRRWQYFCVCGEAVDDVGEAEQLAKAGEVILSGSSWDFCEQHRLRVRHLAGDRAVKVGGWDGLWSHPEDPALEVKEGGVSGLNVERVGAVKVGRQLKLLSLHLRGSCGLGLLGLKGWEAAGGFWPHQPCPLRVRELLLTAGGCLDDACPAPALLRKRCCPLRPGGLVLPCAGP